MRERVCSPCLSIIAAAASKVTEMRAEHQRSAGRRTVGGLNPPRTPTLYTER